MPTSKQTGNRGEDIASIYLEQRGYKIVGRNWRTRWCEIDIVANKNNDIYFIEVKYRSNDIYGDPLEYITTKKEQQMRFAAEVWAHNNNKNDASLRLAAIGIVAGREPIMVEIV